MDHTIPINYNMRMYEFNYSAISKYAIISLALSVLSTIAIRKGIKDLTNYKFKILESNSIAIPFSIIYFTIFFFKNFSSLIRIHILDLSSEFYEDEHDDICKEFKQFLEKSHEEFDNGYDKLFIPLQNEFILDEQKRATFKTLL